MYCYHEIENAFTAHDLLSGTYETYFYSLQFFLVANRSISQFPMRPIIAVKMSCFNAHSISSLSFLPSLLNLSVLLLNFPGM